MASSRKGCEPKSMVSVTGMQRSQKSADAAIQPQRNPGMACDFEIDETTMVRFSSSGTSNGEAKTVLP